jgi:hypothetical protein
MKNQSSIRNIFGIFIFMLFAFTAMAFQDSAKVNKHIEKSILDTVPKNHDIDIQIDTKGLEETIKKSVELAEKTIKQIYELFRISIIFLNIFVFNVGISHTSYKGLSFL